LPWPSPRVDGKPDAPETGCSGLIPSWLTDTDALTTLVSEIAIPDTRTTRADLLALMGQTVELYGGSTPAKLMPALLELLRRNPGLAASVREEFLPGRRAALGEVLGRAIERGDLRDDLDVDFALDVLGGPVFYRLLITGGPIDGRLAEATVELILRGFGPPDTKRDTATDRRDVVNVHVIQTGTVAVKSRQQRGVGTGSRRLSTRCWTRSGQSRCRYSPTPSSTPRA
jgi:Tetracyclin repressor-like, C-terminal domain